MAGIGRRKCSIIGIIFMVILRLSNAQFRHLQQDGGGHQLGQRSQGSLTGSSWRLTQPRAATIDNTDGGQVHIRRRIPFAPRTSGRIRALQQRSGLTAALAQQPQLQLIPITVPAPAKPVAAPAQPDLMSLLSRIVSALPGNSATVAKPAVPAASPAVTARAVHPGLAHNPLPGIPPSPFSMGANPANGGMPFGPFAGMPGMVMSPFGPMSFDTYEDMILDPDMPDPRHRMMMGPPGGPLGGGPLGRGPLRHRMMMGPLGRGPLGGAPLSPFSSAFGAGIPALPAAAPALTPGLEPLRTNPASLSGVAVPDASTGGAAAGIPVGVSQSTIQAALKAALARVNGQQTG